MQEGGSEARTDSSNGAAEEPPVEGRKARVLFDYEPEQDDEIALTPGDIITVYDQDESGWWTGEIGEQYGLFPGAFVEFIDGPRDENYDFLGSTGDEEEQKALQLIAKPERTLSTDKVGSSAPASASQVAEIEALKGKLAASDDARANLQTQVDQLKAALAAATSVAPAASSGSSNSEEVEALRSKVRAYSDEIDGLRAEKARLEQNAVTDAAELNSLRKARAETEGTTNILRRAADAAQAEAAQARGERDAALERVKQLQEANSASAAEAELQAQNAALQRANAQLSQELAQAKAKAAAAAAPAPAPAAAPTSDRSIAEQRLETQVRDLKAALEREQAEKARLLDTMKSEARATVRVAAEKRPPPSSPKPAHVPSSSSGLVAQRAAAVNSASASAAATPERPNVPPRRSMATQPVNPETPAEGSEAWKEKKLKPTGLLRQLP